MPERDALVLFDVGGTDIKAAVAQASTGDLGPVRRVPVVAHADSGGAALTRQLAGLAHELLGGATPVGGALLLPGIVDAAQRRSVFSANLGLRNTNVVDPLSEALGARLAFGHDVGTAAEAEVAEGAGDAGAACTLVVIIGTGIASTVFAGTTRFDVPGAGELGHVPVPGGLRCSCGAKGCLETVASAAAIAKAYHRATGRQVAGAAEVLELARRGDPEASMVWDAAVKALAFALHWCVGLLGVDRVILGGGLSGAGEELLAPLRAALGERLSFMPVPTLVRARLGGDAGLMGARRLALLNAESSESAG